MTWETEKNDAWDGFDPAGSLTDITVNEAGLYSIYLKVALTAPSGLSLSFFDVTVARDWLHTEKASAQSHDVSGVIFLDPSHVYRARVFSTGTPTINSGDFGYRSNPYIAKIKGF